MKQYHAHAAAGFTLIEALIALLVVMIGLLGVAGMQALAVHNTNQAHIRTLAGIDAHGLASVIRANGAYWTDAAAEGTVSIANSSGTISITPSGFVTGTDCATTTCTAAQSAGYSVNQWAQVLTQLPSGTSAQIIRIANTGTSASAYAVTVSWSEQGIQSQGTNAVSGAETKSTTVVVKP